jgi:hypothetical protein
MKPGPVGIVGAQSAHVLGCVIPPVLHREKALLQVAERWLLPAGVTETVIVGFRLECRRLRRSAAGGLRHQPGHVLLGALGQFKLPSRCAGQVQGPVGPGFDERMR